MQSADKMKNFEASLDQYFAYLRCYPPKGLLRIRNDICAALYYNPLLVPGYAPLRTPGGVSKQQVVYIHGIMQVKYFNKVYNIPIHVYVPPTYPSVPPCFFVIPNSTMLIKPRHKFCDTNGIIYHPMISHWEPTFSIAQLIGELGKAFSDDPPIMSSTVVQGPPLPPRSESRPPPEYIQPQLQQTHSQHELPPYAQSKTSNIQSQTNFRSQETFDEKKRRLHSIIYERTTKLRDSVINEMQESEKKDLVSGEDIVLRLAQENEKMTLAAHNVESEIQQIEKWIVNHQNASTNDPTDDMNQTPLKKQLSEAKAADETYDDVLYHISNSFQKRQFGSVPPLELDVYLKLVRKLSRDQFMERALSMKIQATANKY